MKEEQFYILTENLMFVSLIQRRDSPFYETGIPVPFHTQLAAENSAKVMGLKGYSILKAVQVEPVEPQKTASRD